MNNKSIKAFVLFFLCFSSLCTKSMEITPRELLAFSGMAIIVALVGWYWRSAKARAVKIAAIANKIMQQKSQAKELLYEPYGSRHVCATSLYPNKNNDYYVVQKVLTYKKNYEPIHYNDYVVFNNNNEIVHSFSAYNRVYMNLHKVYLFKNKNIVMYFENSNNDDGFGINQLTLYDLDNKITIRLDGQGACISSDENYILMNEHRRSSEYVIIYNITNVADIKVQYIKQKRFSVDYLQFIPHRNQFVAVFDDVDGSDKEVKKLGLWDLSDFNWKGKENCAIPCSRLLIPSKFDFLRCLQSSDDGRYMFCIWNNGLHKGKDCHKGDVYQMINLETFEDSTFPKNRTFFGYSIFPNKTFVGYRLLKYTNLLIKDKSLEPLEIYELDNLSQPLYYDERPLFANNYSKSERLMLGAEDGPQCAISERSPQYLIYRKKDGYSCLLHYDKKKKTIQIARDMIEGVVQDVRDDGYVVSKIKEHLLMYPCVGDGVKIQTTSDANHELDPLNCCKFSATKDQVLIYETFDHTTEEQSPGANEPIVCVRYCRSFKLYTDEMLALCNK